MFFSLLHSEGMGVRLFSRKLYARRFNVATSPDVLCFVSICIRVRFFSKLLDELVLADCGRLYASQRLVPYLEPN